MILRQILLRASRHCSPVRPSALFTQPFLGRLFSTQDEPSPLPSTLSAFDSIVPDASSQRHHDLPSFLAYVERTGLNPKSTVYIGTHYEYTVALALSKFGFSVRRVGGASDFGIDLLGTWKLPSLPDRPIKTILQCKAGPIGPHTVRELEGAFIGAPPGWRSHEGKAAVFGVLAARKTATKGVGDALGRSKWPLVFVSCDEEGRVKQMRWTQRAVDEGLEGIGVSVRYKHDGKGDEDLVLVWKGKALFES